jgi:redox-sensitive bicupin YhaK (pirin superfamily)
VQPGIRARLVAGSFDEMNGPVTEIAAAPVYTDVALEPGSELLAPIAPGKTALAYVFEGAGLFGGAPGHPGELVEAVRMVVFGDGDHVLVRATETSSVRFMLIAGAPFREPIVPYGPFVMNTEAEIRQALADLRNGTFVSN